MNYRTVVITADDSLGVAGTKVIDLNVKDPISRLEIVWKPTLAGQAMLIALAGGITKIELIDGSDVLHSLSGYQNQALCLYDRRVHTMNGGMTLMGAPASVGFGIDFGRHLYDPMLAFVPTRFRNPQLKITHNGALITGTDVTDYLDVFAEVFDEKVISPVGFLMAKEHYSYIAAAENAYEYIDLPTDHPVRQILLRAWHDAADPNTVCDGLKLSEDHDKRIPLDLDLVAYCRRMQGVWVPIQENVVGYATEPGTYTKYVTPTGETTHISGYGLQGTAKENVQEGTKGGKINWYGDNAVYGFVSGYMPHHCYQFPFGMQEDLDDWYDVTKLGSLRARTLSGSDYDTGSEISLVLQQLRRY